MPKSKKKRLIKLIKEVAAILVWASMIMSLCGYPLDSLITNAIAPNLASMLCYRIPIFLGIFGLVWVLMGNKRFFLFISYIALYPVLLLLGRGIKKLLLNWERAFIFAPFAFDIATNFKLYISRLVLAVLSIVVIGTGQHYIPIMYAMSILFVLFGVHLYRTFKRAYQSNVFSRLARITTTLRKVIEKETWLTDIASPNNNDEHEKDRPPSDDNPQKTSSPANQVQTVYMVHWFFDYLRIKLDAVVKSKKMDIYLVFSWFYTVATTVVVYAFIYFGLYKIDSSAFSGESPFFSFWSFLGFSFGKLAPTEISTIVPVSSVAQMLCYSELACAVVVFMILIFTILTAARERYQTDVNGIIADLNGCAEAVQSACNKVFDMAINDAELFLLADHSSLVNNLRKLRGLNELPVPEKENVENTD